MAAVSINRYEKLPEICAVCGQATNQIVAMKLAPRDGSSLTAVAFTPRLIRRLPRAIPSISWSLPFCDVHASQIRFKQKLQPALLFVGVIAIASGCWTLYGTHLTWSFVVLLGLGAILIAVAHHTRLGPFRVTKNVLELSSVNEDFAARLTQMNPFVPEVIEKGSSKEQFSNFPTFN